MSEKSMDGHRSDEITSYLSETLEPAERAAFEAHLQGCEECQRDLAAQKALFAQVNEVLAVKPKRTIEEQVARFEKMVAAERAAAQTGKPLEKRRRRVPAWAIGLGAATAAAAVAAVGIWETASPRPEPGKVYAPRRPGLPCDAGAGVDAGCEEADGGR
jgi:anti-sigma factor RsiW